MDLHFAQISDIHISTLGDYADLLSGHAADFLSDTLARLNRWDDLDFVLITGDLFNAPTPENVAIFQQLIATLQKPCYIIPGNHDRRDLADSTGLTRHQFAQLFNPQVHERPTHLAAQNGYWSVTVKPGFQLIGLDSNRDTDWGGSVDPPQLAWLKDELLTHTDKLVIVAIHHPCQRLAPIDDQPEWRNFVCDNGPQLLALLDQYPQVKLVLSGHHHQTKADLLGQRLHLAGPALTVYPCAYRSLRLSHFDGVSCRIEWQTHLVANEATMARARRMMLEAWGSVGFEPTFIETHARLAWGNEWDRTGRVEL
jgi:3',5'-cyclic AMP phosphodiesterase CpdA